VDSDFNWAASDLETLFVLTDKLGEGAFGSVFMGKLTTGGKPMAIKILNLGRSFLVLA